MKKVNGSRIVVWVAVTGMLGASLTTGGCVLNRLSMDSRLPDKSRLVGGGMMIEWKAPEAGTVYLVEKQTGKIVETRSLQEDEVYSFTATSIVQADEFEQMLGVKFRRAHFLLYFKPAGAADAASTDESSGTDESVRTWSRS